ncbi:hypothetical protein BP00DRAFT_343555, partial [Aspergillus indologenus CBS 114.80]
TYNHRVWKIGLPVRSAVLKPHAGRLVVGWVTTSESLLLYVFCFIYWLYLEYCTIVVPVAAYPFDAQLLVCELLGYSDRESNGVCSQNHVCRGKQAQSVSWSFYWYEFGVRAHD